MYIALIILFQKIVSDIKINMCFIYEYMNNYDIEIQIKKISDPSTSWTDNIKIVNNCMKGIQEYGKNLVLF